VAVHAAEVVARALVVHEEEELVLDDRPPQRGPELLVARRSLGAREVVLGQRAVSVPEEEGRSFELVGPRLEGHVGDGSPRAAELGVIVARAHAHRLDRVGRRDDHGEESGAVVIVDPVQHHVVGQAGLAVHVGGKAVLGVEELGVGTEGPRGSRHRHQKALEVAVEGERHLGDLLALDEPSGVGPVGLEGGCLLHHGHRFGHGADLEHEVHPHRRVDVHRTFSWTVFPNPVSSPSTR